MGGIVGRLFREFAIVLSIGHRHLARRLADRHAHALLKVPAGARTETARPTAAFYMAGEVVAQQDRLAGTTSWRSLRAAPSAHRVVAIAHRSPARSPSTSTFSDSQGLLSAAGYRPSSPARFAGPAGRLLRHELESKAKRDRRHRDHPPGHRRASRHVMLLLRRPAATVRRPTPPASSSC